MALKQGSLFEPDEPKYKALGDKLFLGTSGSSFPDWKGIFYPDKLPRNKYLEYYAEHFNALEVNTTYYALPSKKTFANWVERTPDNFKFWVKVPGTATHSEDDLKEVMKPYFEATEPLAISGKLCGSLAQFPESFKPSKKNWQRLKELSGMFLHGKLAVEIRSSTWQTDEFREFLKENGVISVLADLPKIEGLPDQRLWNTSNNLYIRFHGRNRMTWYNPDLGDRYDYDYSDTELHTYLSEIKKSKNSLGTTYLFFNNCHAGHAVKNALAMQKLLENEIEGSD